MTTSPDVIELRPDPSEYVKGLKSRGKWLIPIFVILGARLVVGISEGGLGTVLAGLVLLVLVGGLGIAFVHIRTSVMRLTPGGLQHDGFFVRSRSIGVDDAAGLLAPMGAQLAAPTVDVLVVQERGGEAIRIAGGLWTREALEQIAHHSGVPIEPKEISGKEFERRVPGTIPLRFRRPAIFGLVVGVVLCVAVVVGTWAWFVVYDIPFGE